MLGNIPYTDPMGFNKKGKISEVNLVGFLKWNLLEKNDVYDC